MDEEEQPCKKLKTLLGLLGHDDSDIDEEEIPCLNTNTKSKGGCKIE